MSNGDTPNRNGGGRRQGSAARRGFSALPSETRLVGRYVIDSVIGSGGFGITYLARHEALGKFYAIKEHFPRQYAFRDEATASVYPSDPETFKWALDRFLLESRSLARLKHPAIVGVADVFEALGTAYMVLEFEDGMSLGRWLEAIGRMPTQIEMDAIAGPLIDALAYLHSKDMLHRDLAPDNIMIRQDGTPCLIDFGAARQAIAERSQVLSAIVKAGYSPPEQYTTAGRSQGPWTDIYALAGTLYRAVAGTRPTEATERQIEDDLQPVASMLPPEHDFRPEFLTGIDAGLRLRPGDRPQSMADWHQMLAIPGPAPVHRPTSQPQASPSRPAWGAGGEASRPPASAPQSPSQPAAASAGQPQVPAKPAGELPGYPEMTRRTAEKDARRGRLLVAGVLGGVILLFGSNLAGLWQTPSQRVEPQSPRSTPVPPRTDPPRVQQDVPKRVPPPGPSPQPSGDGTGGRLGVEPPRTQPPPSPAPGPQPQQAGRPNLRETDCQTSKPLQVIVPACSSIISDHNDFAEAYYVRGWALRERRQYERAITDFTRVIQLEPQNAAAHSQRALSYTRLGEHRRALTDYDEAIRIAPRNAGYANDRGLVHLALNDFDRAIADFDKATELNPRFALPFNNRGWAIIQRDKDHRRAIAQFDRAIELQPRYALAFENRGISYIEVGDLDRGIADLGTAIEINANSARAHNARGVGHERKGNRTQAIADYRKALSLDSQFRAPADNLRRLGETP